MNADFRQTEIEEKKLDQQRRIARQLDICARWRIEKRQAVSRDQRDQQTEQHGQADAPCGERQSPARRIDETGNSRDDISAVHDGDNRVIKGTRIIGRPPQRHGNHCLAADNLKL